MSREKPFLKAFAPFAPPFDTSSRIPSEHELPPGAACCCGLPFAEATAGSRP